MEIQSAVHSIVLSLARFLVIHPNPGPAFESQIKERVNHKETRRNALDAQRKQPGELPFIRIKGFSSTIDTKVLSGIAMHFLRMMQRRQ